MWLFVQMLTHIKEKLQFVSAENSVVRKQLQCVPSPPSSLCLSVNLAGLHSSSPASLCRLLHRALDGELSKERDNLTKAKREREALRAENAGLRQKQGFTNSDLLVVDFEQRKQELQSIRDEIGELKQRYQLLSSVVDRVEPP